ncbi:MAG: MFS transporter [Acidobacteriota bacterium]|nr:MFS transporter [Acidobacteriota bacterium]
MAVDRTGSGSWWWPTRELAAYPGRRARLGYLGLTALVTVTLYYLVGCGASVVILQMADLHISFHFLLWTAAAGNLVGVAGAWFAGLTDRIGRVWTVMVGLTLGSLLTLFAIPNAPNRWVFAALTLFHGTLEGVVLVATPALMRDFSPQAGRGGAMGFWTLGPVAGALITSAVGSLTIHGTPVAAFWGHEYVIAGAAGLAVSVLAFFFLKELSPQLRDQLLVSDADRGLAQIEAENTDVDAALRNQWRQMIRSDILISGFAVSFLLVAFYSAIAVGTISFVVVFGFDLHHANMLGDWMWAANAIAVLSVGLLSDRLGVRKPFMAAGAVITAVGLVVYLEHFGHHTTFASTALMASTITFGLGISFTPWLTNFTETVEAHNPALAATGLAVWGLTLRVVTFIALGLLPVVVSSMTPLVDFVVGTTPYTNDLIFAADHPALIAAVENPGNAAQLDALAALVRDHPAQMAQIEANTTYLSTLTEYAPEVRAIAANPAVFTRLAANPNDPATDAAAIAALGGGALAQQRLATLITHSSQIVPALVWAQAHPDAIALAQDHSQTLLWAQRNSALVAQASRYSAPLTALRNLPAGVADYANANAGAATVARQRIPTQLRNWYWICLGGPIIFMLSIPLLRGRWSPRRARADLAAHRDAVDQRLAALPHQ